MSLKDRLNKKEIILGSRVSLGHPSIVEIFAKAGLDWVVIDLEHSVITISSAADLIRIIDLCGVAPLVRLTSNSPDQIKRVMDAGAHGIIVPMVKTEEEAEKAVAATRYEPQGNRGVGLARAQGYGPNFQEYLKWQENSPIVIVQIEHIDAIRNIESILNVDGVDGLIIGPYDLSASMGIPGQFDNAEFVQAVDQIKKSALKKKCVIGTHIVEPDHDHLKKAISDGFNFIAFSVDVRILDNAMRSAINEYRELTQ